MYETLFNAGLGEEIGIRQDHEAIYSNLKDIINAGVAAGTLNMNPFNRWFTDIDTVIAQLKSNNDKAKSQISSVYGQNYSIGGTFNSATDVLETSRKSLYELNNFLVEVLTSIRNQQK